MSRLRFGLSCGISFVTTLHCKHRNEAPCRLYSVKKVPAQSHTEYFHAYPSMDGTQD